MVASLAVGRRKMFDGETLALSACCTLPSGGEIFLRLYEDVLPSAAFFSIDTGFVEKFLHKKHISI
jgi:hypothetical protein